MRGTVRFVRCARYRSDRRWGPVQLRSHRPGFRHRVSGMEPVALGKSSAAAPKRRCHRRGGDHGRRAAGRSRGHLCGPDACAAILAALRARFESGSRRSVQLRSTSRALNAASSSAPAPFEIEDCEEFTPKRYPEPVMAITPPLRLRAMQRRPRREPYLRAFRPSAEIFATIHAAARPPPDNDRLSFHQIIIVPGVQLGNPHELAFFDKFAPVGASPGQRPDQPGRRAKLPLAPPGAA